ncbi:MAG TPA: MBL fold metallo-hydrolase [Polyangiaceae bacterium]|nr:MBL fold metallo-hydrolase [Polyangiaceae bacterium]
MKKTTVIYTAGDHTWRVVARDPERPSHLIDTNEYVVSNGAEAILTDPGGQEIFPAVFSALSVDFDPRRITHIFSSHQDPDVISSLALWLAFKPSLRCYASWLWSSFIPHFGGNPDTIIDLPDEPTTIQVGSQTLQTVPAHYLHSSGNLQLYDPAAKILFAGDIGAALLPADEHGLFVKDFDRHVRYAEGFHRRWMGSEQAKLDWCERASHMAIDMLCPQHGAIYQGADVGRFINWLADLKIGKLRTGTQRS